MPPHYVLGLMGVSPSNPGPHLSTAPQLTAFLTTASRAGIRDLDTARAYASGTSETLLGSLPKSLVSQFRISTKAPAFSPGSLSRENIIRNCNDSLSALGGSEVDIYYLHGPDPSTGIREQCDALASLHREGKFRRWGVSNVPASTVREMVAYCAEQGYKAMEVYQGCYNPVHREVEEELFPTLRELGIKFYAFGPLAGGLLAKSVDAVLEPEEGGRFDVMKVYGGVFLGKEGVVDGVRELERVCKARGIEVKEATIRWFRWHSALGDGDGVILGASRVEQVEDVCRFIDGGKLDDEIVQAFENLWERIRSKK